MSPIGWLFTALMVMLLGGFIEHKRVHDTHWTSLLGRTMIAVSVIMALASFIAQSEVNKEKKHETPIPIGSVQQTGNSGR